MAGSGKSKEDIVSQALIMIGEAPISSFTEGTGGLVAGNIYATTRDDLLTAYRWRFAMRKNSLSRLVDTPRNEWEYAFQLPSDLLMLVRTYPNSTYEVYRDFLYSNNASVDIDYVYRPDVGFFPAYFVKALIYKLAEEMAISITNNQGLAERMEMRATKALAKATYVDSQGRPADPIVSRPFIDVRRGRRA